jgi:hypothetical protein
MDIWRIWGRKMHTAFRWGIRKETDYLGDNFKNTSSINSIGSVSWINVARDRQIADPYEHGNSGFLYNAGNFLTSRAFQREFGSMLLINSNINIQEHREHNRCLLHKKHDALTDLCIRQL